MIADQKTEESKGLIFKSFSPLHPLFLCVSSFAVLLRRRWLQGLQAFFFDHQDDAGVAVGHFTDVIFRRCAQHCAISDGVSAYLSVSQVIIFGGSTTEGVVQ
jgi:hypothetical protein